ncbi:hypothetical protein AMTRI_Chr11g154470 [Amborella trichopoda]|uniref:ABC transporter domain-containing protein n=1 Tax=Amborella trichopoda TaxID=13333 RepID=W1P5J9_AMBTC|nr:ABC transporter G family member 25 [Amborella trichopoda]ERN02964.1 hypothetical protein AMTR_s00134p00069640 [Amborella trichopoda]|eukprot:XP_011622191.2 ABC transporter G family member 25 [Amborella trichopoda]
MFSGVRDGEGGDECETRVESLLSPSFPVTVKFVDITYRIKLQSTESTASSILSSIIGSKPPRKSIEERTVLKGITGVVSPGEILAILGPSGSGKTTFLSFLGGKLDGKFAGTLLANGQKVTKSIRRKTGFVTQDDLLYPHLTVRETLIYSALLRLPKTVSKREKVGLAESVLSELGLNGCGDSIVGSAFVRGISGGERKRVSIGQEMLVNPSLLLLDEPTSGLDSTAAYKLVTTLRGLARKGKAVVATMHQPSSRVYQIFHSVLLLSDGNCLYFGKGSEAMDYFSSIGFSPAFAMNPADFMIDLANGVTPDLKLVAGQVETQGDAQKPKLKQFLISSFNKSLAPKVKANVLATITTEVAQNPGTKRHDSELCTTWTDQFSVLLRRSLKERRHESFGGLRILQVGATAVLAGSMWWQSSACDVLDRVGLLFFISIFWGVFPVFNSVFTFPQERPIFIKERGAGMYKLSAYVAAKAIGDLPMELVLPTAFTIVAYWMAGLRADAFSFLLTLGVVLYSVLVGQGLGLALGAAIMDAKRATAVASVTMMAFLLVGGYYVRKVPHFVRWLKYTSFTYYAFGLLIHIQYRGAQSQWCNGGGGGGAVMELPGPALCVGALAAMLVGYRLLAYIALRRVKV